MSERERPVCPDGGACHHECKPRQCFRVHSCGPLSGVYKDDEWPKHVAEAFSGDSGDSGDSEPVPCEGGDGDRTPVARSVQIGGYECVRSIDDYDCSVFAVDVYAATWERVLESDDAARELYAALTNTRWFNDAHGLEEWFTFRAAGDLVASVRKAGNYLDWYGGDVGFVAPWVATAMAEAGWRWEAVPA